MLLRSLQQRLIFSSIWILFFLQIIGLILSPLISTSLNISSHLSYTYRKSSSSILSLASYIYLITFYLAYCSSLFTSASTNPLISIRYDMPLFIDLPDRNLDSKRFKISFSLSLKGLMTRLLWNTLNILDMVLRKSYFMVCLFMQAL